MAATGLPNHATAADSKTTLSIEHTMTIADMETLGGDDRAPLTTKYTDFQSCTQNNFRMLMIVYFGMDPLPADRLFGILPKVTIEDQECVSVKITSSIPIEDQRIEATECIHLKMTAAL